MGGGHATGRWRTPFLPLRMRACAGEWKPPQQCAVPVAGRLHPLPWLSAGVKHNNGQSGNGKPRAPPFCSLPCGPLPAPAPTHHPRAPTRGHHPRCIPCSARPPPTRSWPCARHHPRELPRVHSHATLEGGMHPILPCPHVNYKDKGVQAGWDGSGQGRTLVRWRGMRASGAGHACTRGRDMYAQWGGVRARDREEPGGACAREREGVRVPASPGGSWRQ